jgi:hypothetical protein
MRHNIVNNIVNMYKLIIVIKFKIEIEIS